MDDFTRDRYTFKMVQSDGTIITIEGDKLVVSEIITQFHQWLVACTYTDACINRAMDEMYGTGE